jgi:hypothetical protein
VCYVRSLLSGIVSDPDRPLHPPPKSHKFPLVCLITDSPALSAPPRPAPPRPAPPRPAPPCPAPPRPAPPCPGRCGAGWGRGGAGRGGAVRGGAGRGWAGRGEPAVDFFNCPGATGTPATTSCPFPPRHPREDESHGRRWVPRLPSFPVGFSDPLPPQTRHTMLHTAVCFALVLMQASWCEESKCMPRRPLHKPRQHT